MNPGKTKVRKEMLVARRKVGASDAQKWSEQICRRALEKLSKAKKVAVYIAINNEVDTRCLIDELNKQKIELYVPTFSLDRETYAFCQFKNWSDLEKGPFNILQPIDTEAVFVNQLDVVFIPGVAFDEKGTRLGYGKGIYDRLLAKSRALIVGLAYDFQVVDQLPKEEHDLKMDVIITEKQVLKLSS